MGIKKHIATISILIKDRQTNAGQVQKILTEHGNIVIARTGVHITRGCVERCTGIITLILEGPKRDINKLNKKIDNLYGIVSKVTFLLD